MSPSTSIWSPVLSNVTYGSNQLFRTIDNNLQDPRCLEQLNGEGFSRVFTTPREVQQIMIGQLEFGRITIQQAFNRRSVGQQHLVYRFHHIAGYEVQRL